MISWQRRKIVTQKLFQPFENFKAVIFKNIDFFLLTSQICININVFNKEIMNFKFLVWKMLFFRKMQVENNSISIFLVAGLYDFEASDV